MSRPAATADATIRPDPYAVPDEAALAALARRLEERLGRHKAADARKREARRAAAR